MKREKIIVGSVVILLALTTSFVGTLFWFSLYEWLRNRLGMSFLEAVTTYSVGISLLVLSASLMAARRH